MPDTDDLPSTRGRILDAAMDRFSKKGYHDTKLDEIVDDARVSKGSIYFHFPSKEKLFLALVDQFADLLERRVDEAIAPMTSSMARVRVAVETVLDTFSRYRQPAKLLLVQALGLGSVFEKKRQQVNERFALLIEKHLREAVAAGEIPPIDTEVTAHAWMGAIYGLTIQWLLTGDPNKERIIGTLPAMLMRSVQYVAPIV